MTVRTKGKKKENFDYLNTPSMIKEICIYRFRIDRGNFERLTVIIAVPEANASRKMTTFLISLNTYVRIRRFFSSFFFVFTVF